MRKGHVLRDPNSRYCGGLCGFCACPDFFHCFSLCIQRESLMDTALSISLGLFVTCLMYSSSMPSRPRSHPHLGFGHPPAHLCSKHTFSLVPIAGSVYLYLGAERSKNLHAYSHDWRDRLH